MSAERVTEEKKIIKLADGKEYEIKQLCLADIKKFLPLIIKLDELRQKGLSEELIDLMAEICLIALQKTNPDLTKEKVLELVELPLVFEIVSLSVGTFLK